MVTHTGFLAKPDDALGGRAEGGRGGEWFMLRAEADQVGVGIVRQAEGSLSAALPEARTWQ